MITKKILIIGIVSACLAAPSFVFADPPSGTTSIVPPSGSTPTATYTLEDPLGVKNFCDLVKALLDIILAIGVPIAVLFLVWAGFKFILARGNATELGVARKNFMYVIIGIAVFLGAWTLATIISTTLQSLSTPNSASFCGK
jgi:hypothetical protein